LALKLGNTAKKQIIGKITSNRNYFKKDYDIDIIQVDPP
jgi:hypothetical protein